MDEQKKAANNIDDWLSELDEPAEAPESDSGEPIDSLFDEGTTKAGENASNAEGETMVTDSDIVGQEDIEDLLADNEEETPQASTDNGSGMDDMLLDQSEIDSLLSTPSAPAKQEEEKESSPEALDEFAELNESDLDELFGSAESTPAQAAVATDDSPSQEEMDQLFADLSTHGVETHIPKKSEQKDSAPPSPLGNAFDFKEEETTLAGGEFPDLPDIEDETSPDAEPPPADDIFSAKESKALHEELTTGIEQPFAPEEKGGRLPFPIPLSGSLLAGIALGLFLVAGGLYYFLSPGKEKKPAIPPVEIEKPLAGKIEEKIEPAPEPAVLPANTAPTVADLEHGMTDTTDALTITLAGTDREGDPLEFVITDPPEYGRLSGSAPNLTYLPNRDFPGRDSFSYRASDGRDISPAGTVVITGPALAAKPAGPPKTMEPERLIIHARDVTMTTDSTSPLTIDWQDIWRMSNNLPFDPAVMVIVSSGSMEGVLKKISRKTHLYTPDPYWAGTETLRYHFNRAGVRSKSRTLRLVVSQGDPPPTIRLKQLEEAYTVGDTVVLDASATIDDQRSMLLFNWEQTAGIPVRLESINQEGSIIAFTAPSSFYTTSYPSPVIRLTTVDQSGQSDSLQIEIRTKSKRSSALWGWNRQ